MVYVLLMMIGMHGVNTMRTPRSFGESKVQEALKNLSLVPRHEFEIHEALVTNLETKIRHLEQRLAEMEEVGATNPITPDEN